MASEELSKKCKYCGKDFYKKDFPKVFQRMVTCGSDECKAKNRDVWTKKAVCLNCGERITRGYKYCRKCAFVGEKNPFFGKTHSKESLLKIKLFKKGHVPFMKGRCHTEQANIKNSIAHQKGEEIRPLHFGKNLKNAIRNSTEYKLWRSLVFKRDKYICQNKKCNQYGGALEAHHKVSFKQLVKQAMERFPLLSAYEACMLYTPFWDIKNGITLCVKCHRRKEGKYICKGE